MMKGYFLLTTELSEEIENKLREYCIEVYTLKALSLYYVKCTNIEYVKELDFVIVIQEERMGKL